jgi:DNA-binding GntR family transcriptional regulator
MATLDRRRDRAASAKISGATGADLVRNQTVAKLRAAISSGRFLPGSRLIDRELCEVLGVSRTSVREAVRQLEASRLVKVEARRGSVVVAINVRDAEEIYATRKLLEAEVVRLFIHNADQAMIDLLSGHLNEFILAVKRRDVQIAVEVMTSFYRTLSTGAGNKVLADLLDHLNVRISYLRATSMSSPHRMDRSAVEMTKLFRSIERRNEKAARRACLEHITNAAEAAIRRLQWDEQEKSTASRHRRASAKQERERAKSTGP